jgi:hypothetical protein
MTIGFEERKYASFYNKMMLLKKSSIFNINMSNYVINYPFEPYKSYSRV